ncbi:hypothetical protein DOTSEDRAFT_37942 [Dothistroma septosporum NZE10]|uniref:Uncharacterized protein n=1 Tax=Dothistroma septosporum (strain NZE10 / CBS 128990) TaxID=675120 RepID=N1PE89_DOTSN|nr:hypothetical protein DOTSEDRAFT_37942 [Dothistroma septosporum NZE10]
MSFSAAARSAPIPCNHTEAVPISITYTFVGALQANPGLQADDHRREATTADEEASATAAMPPRASFMGIPPELRLNIYHHLFSKPTCEKADHAHYCTKATEPHETDLCRYLSDLARCPCAASLYGATTPDSAGQQARLCRGHCSRPWQQLAVRRGGTELCNGPDTQLTSTPYDRPLLT